MKMKFFVFTLLGTMLTGLGIGCFLTPNQVVGGGISGLSTILYYTLNVAPGISFFVINCLLLIAGIKILGKTFVTKTLFGATLLSFFVQLFA